MSEKLGPLESLLITIYLFLVIYVQQLVKRNSEFIYYLNVSLYLKYYIAAFESACFICFAYFNYCSSAWSRYKLSDIDLLENVKRNFTIRLEGLKELPYEERLNKCGLVSLELRRLRKDLALCYQIIEGQIALDFKEFL